MTGLSEIISGETMRTDVAADDYVGTTTRAEPGGFGHENAPGAGGVKPNVSDRERLMSIAGGALLATVGFRMRSLSGLLAMGAGAALVHRGYTGHCKLYEALGTSSATPASPADYFDRGLHAEVAFTIAKPRSELYAFWRNFENLPRFMKHLQSVTVLDDKRSKWVATAPAGRTVEWEAEIINEQQDELIAWRSLGGASVDNAGSVRFLDAPGDRGTEVRVVMDYIPPAGKLGKWIAMLFGEAPEIAIREDLRRFKQLMEAGELPTIEGQPMGTCSC